MALITPVGKEFDWSPKQTNLVKTASTKGQPKSDKDALYEAAKKFVKAQVIDEIAPETTPSDTVEIDVAPDGDIGEIVPEVPATKEVSEEVPAESSATVDVQKAVKDLVDKSNKAEEISNKVQDAVSKVEQAVQEVKDAVGDVVKEEVAEGEVTPDSVELEIEEEGEEGEEGEEKAEEVDEAEETEETEETEEETDKKEDEIVQESCKASKKVPAMKSAAKQDDLIALAALSPSVKKKVYDYYKNELKYPADYCKLLVQDN